MLQLHNEIESLKCRNRGSKPPKPKTNIFTKIKLTNFPELQFQLLMGAPAGTTSSLIPTSGSDAPTNLTTLANPSNLGTPEDAADIHGNNLTLISTLGGVAPLQVYSTTTISKVPKRPKYMLYVSKIVVVCIF